MATEELLDILLVEDNESDEKLTLHAMKCYHPARSVHVVRDGAEALTYLFCEGAYLDRRGGNPRMILLDMWLPKLDGIEVLRQIRADGRTRHIPVIMLTSAVEDRTKIESYKLGVNSFIAKPLDFEQARRLGDYWLILNRQPASGYSAPPPGDVSTHGQSSV